MLQLRINWILPDGVTVRRQTLPLITEDLTAIQNIVNEMANLTTRTVDSAIKIKYETVM
jgi:hypothetical protein